ncbi:MAG: amidohydrolase family protein [Parahaliea sp.]
MKPSNTLTATRRAGWLAACFVLLISGHLAWAERIIIEGVTLIDGTGTPPRPAMTVVIDDGRFIGIGPDAPSGYHSGRRVDGRGKFLIPGLMDMHVHLQGGVEVTPRRLRSAGNDREKGQRALHSYLFSGVTAIYDAGNNPDFIFSLRADERAGRIDSPRIFAAGGVVTAPGGHGSDVGATLVESWPQDRKAMAEHLDKQPDLVKFTFDERGWGARPLIPLLDLDIMQTLIEYCNDGGIRTTAHVSSERRARQAIYAGIDNLSHPVIQGPITDAFARLMAAKKIPMTSTLTIGENYSRLAEHPEFLQQALYQQALSPEETEHLGSVTRNAYQKDMWTWWMKLMTPVAQENLRSIHEAGGIVVLGTDQTLGPAVHREAELLQAAGIPPLDIIRMATLNGAIFLGRERDMGSIETGKLADAVLLDSDPSVDIDNLKHIAIVIKDGRIIDRDRLRQPATSGAR